MGHREAGGSGITVRSYNGGPQTARQANTDPADHAANKDVSLLPISPKSGSEPERERERGHR